MTTTDLEYLINDENLAEAARTAFDASPDIDTATASDLRPVHKGFKDFVGGDAYGVSEVAIVTILQAIASDRPVLFLPLTALGRFQHQTLISVKDLTVDELAGRTVGVRSWSQTTGMWVRGILTDQYKTDLRAVNWRTYGGGHLDELPDPAWVQRAEAGAVLADDLLGGRVDFAIMGNDRPQEPQVKDVIPDAREVAEDWAAEVGFVPVNHVFGVRADLARAHSNAILRCYDEIASRLLSRRDGENTPVMEPFGFAALRPAVTAAARYAWEQDLLPRQISYDEIVDLTTSALGVSASRLGA
ncbi:hypothetical protein [Brevibacterium oceani]|uniref:hypothetical protein n=1 Tax=Brevibacterium oceani TaxID=358099 RepID=UPI001B32D256|nr:hypothetical protein [Brevibacterium oceani]